MDNSIAASIGLVSDTHYQDRLFDLPAGLPDLWAGVHLILHAGDVGDMRVLDLLGRIAPTIAVHGNDEPDCTQRDLPAQQLVTVDGQRILLCHSHYADPIEEKANRGGPWGPKLERIANRGRELNAQMVVYGHTHVPMMVQYPDVLLINPGALAAGSYFTRQAISSVARLDFLENGEINTTHFDIATNQARVFDEANPAEDFGVLARKYEEWLVEPDLIPVIALLRQIILEDARAVVRAFIPLYQRCLANGPMRRDDLIRTINSGDGIAPNDKQRILAVLKPS